MSSFRTIRTTRSTRSTRTTRTLRPHVLRRDGVIQAPSDAVGHDRYRQAVRAGYRSLV